MTTHTAPPSLRPCVTAHAGARDHYQLSRALHEVGLLERLVTEAYAPDWLHRLVPGPAGKRHSLGLPSSAVTVSAKALALTAHAQLTRCNQNHRIDQTISRAAYRTAAKTRANLFLYSYYAYPAFRQALAEDSPARRFLFQLHPHPNSVRQLLAEEMERLPFAAQSIRDEEEFRLDADRSELLARESALATFCVTASRFTQETLLQNGVPADRIAVVPYGVDARAFPMRTQPPMARTFRVIFVGRMNQRKGLADLLQAVRLLNYPKTEVVLCGRGYVDLRMLHEYRDLHLRVLLSLSTEQLVQELHQSHVFVLPSLAEGFGHVILEAMAAGLPVIATANTAGPDVLEPGKHGFLVPIRQPQRIAEYLEAALRHPDTWFMMGQAAAHQARRFTWERFRSGVAGVYKAELTKQSTCAL